MKHKISIGILVLLVSTLMLMSNALASAGPPVWLAQATLSIPDSNPAKDPENSGHFMTQVAAWEEWNGANWDIWVKFSLLDGALGSWFFPATQPAITAADEINPAIAVSQVHPSSGQEIHVVYQLLNPVSGINEIWHTWKLLGIPWVPPVLMSNPTCDALDPAIVYTEDINSPGPGNNGMLMQMVWAEETAPGSGLYQIQYDAFYFDPVAGPMRGYVSTLPLLGGPPLIGVTTIQAPPAGCTCMYPEIASVDENSPLRMGAVDFDFSVVWQETTAAGQWNIWYADGTTQTSPMGTAFVAVNPVGQINPVTNTSDCYHPDIAATQDYLSPIAPETYYFHVNWVRFDTATGNFYIESCYAVGGVTTPGPGAFIMVVPAAQGPTLATLDNPTVATKLTGLAPSVFETWMAWEDSTNPGATNPDIWYRVGAYTVGAPPFGYTWGPGRVGYTPGVGMGSIEYNPELWNRNDWFRTFPPLTHLVFDQDLGGGIPEVEYIDP
jgi:hypothetical protein